MKFEKRLTSPSATNKFYLKAGKGGYNRALEINKTTHSCLPNCCGLVHGRWLESQNQNDYKKYDKLCIGNAKSYYNKNDGYKRGQSPKLGSIICFTNKRSGHVAFVEDIKSNGDIVTSNSGYNGTRFFIKTLKKSNNYQYGNGYKFQGFIYSPIEFEIKFNLMRLLKKRCKGNDVKELQKELINLGYDLGKYGADGIFGNDTLKAVKQFQRDNKLYDDGIVGKNTAHKLNWLYRGK